MKFNSQNEALYNYLLNHKGITTWEAVDKLGITCLHKRAKELEESGHKIHRTWLEGRNRYGNKSRVIRYSLG